MDRAAEARRDVLATVPDSTAMDVYQQMGADHLKNLDCKGTHFLEESQVNKWAENGNKADPLKGLNTDLIYTITNITEETLDVNYTESKTTTETIDPLDMSEHVDKHEGKPIGRQHSPKQDIIEGKSSSVACNSNKPSERTEVERRKKWAQQKRERRAKEAPEEKEARRLRERIARMKSRLMINLGITEEESKIKKNEAAKKMRAKRKILYEKETFEQSAERKRKQALQAQMARFCQRAIESPEEAETRKAAQRAYNHERYKHLRMTAISEEHRERKDPKSKCRANRKEKANGKVKCDRPTVIIPTPTNS